MAMRTIPNPTMPSATGRADALVAADQTRLRRYTEYLDFYNGRQWAKPRQGRTNLVLNYARAIVDKGASYLLGRGLNFAVPTDAERGRRGDAERAEELLYQVYEENDLEAVDIQGAINGAVLGDTVFKLFWEQPYGTGGKAPRDRGRIRVVNIDPFTFFPRWAGDDPSTLLSVSVVYQLSAEEAEQRYGDGETEPVSALKGRANSHYREVSPAVYGQKQNKGLPVTVLEEWTDTKLTLTVGDREVIRTANPYGFIPFVHIPNARPANEFWGVSDLKEMIPLNRELNERMSDMADVIRFHSDPPVIFKGVMEHTKLAVGPGTVWDVPEGAEVELLEWRGQAPAVHEHIERVMRALHDITETPKTAFGDSGRLLSGVALETELQPLIHKTLRKRAWWNAGLRRRNRYILRIAELNGLGSFAPYRSRIIWPPLLPADSEADVRNNVALVSAGLRSRRTAMNQLGEESPDAELRRIEEETHGESLRRVQGAAHGGGLEVAPSIPFIPSI